MDIMESSLQKHFEWQGKIEIVSRCRVSSREELSNAYTPGVAKPCLEIQKNPDLSFSLTRRGNLVAVITDGSAVLGLGDIGGVASMPVMEGKCALFKEFAGVDAFPICIGTKDTDEFIRTVELIADSFGGINLEDIAAPRCFEIERRLKEKLSIPVFHDDQHGTAIVASAAMRNAAKLAGKTFAEMTLVINGAGAAGCAIAERFLDLGIGDLILVDIDGIIEHGKEYANKAHTSLARRTNRAGKRGSLFDALKGADAFIGVSRPDLVTAEMVKSMAERSIVFAMANPSPEIMPDIAKAAGAFIVGTGRSDFPNQINNVIAFPGIFKGALSVRAKEITPKMMTAASIAIADYLPENELTPERILPDAFDKKIAETVAEAVAKAAQTE
ncbi:MAG: NADP-dependent malic enzyme [Ruminococcus sp.]|jgi:malate dehydrogenase (oxaloacetate-decarboxylating)|nr:NADP-dependent malic enzyme [Ruminococcus sp.]